MKNVIMVPALGDLGQKMFSISGESVRRYAERIGVELVVITEHKLMALSEQARKTWPYDGDKFQVLDLLDRYDRVLMLDADIILAPSCPDVFDEIPAHCTGWSVRSEQVQSQIIRTQMRKMGFKGSFNPVLDCAIANTGLIMLPRVHGPQMNMVRLLCDSPVWFNLEPCMHFVFRSLTSDIARFDERHNVSYMDYPGVKALPSSHICSRYIKQYAAIGVDFLNLWRQAYSVHYSAHSTITTVENRLAAMRAGYDYFYGGNSGDVQVL
jgi:hypothetical protein